MKTLPAASLIVSIRSYITASPTVQRAKIRHSSWNFSSSVTQVCGGLEKLIWHSESSMHAKFLYIGLNWVTSPDTIKIGRYMWTILDRFCQKLYYSQFHCTESRNTPLRPKEVTVAETLLKKCAGQLSVVWLVSKSIVNLRSHFSHPDSSMHAKFA